MSRHPSLVLLLLSATLIPPLPASAQMPRILSSCSTANATRADFLAVNNTANSVDLYWLDYQCQEQHVATIAAGGVSSNASYVGHAWRMRERQNQRLLQQVTVASATKKYVVADEKCSGRYGDPASLKIVNTLPFPIELRWRGFDCREMPHSSISPGGSLEQSTSTSHAWVARRSDNGSLVQEFSVDRGGAYEIRIGQRSAADRIDDQSFYQVHPLYVLASDGVDRELDRNGTIASSLASAQAWLAANASGQRLRLDLSGGGVDTSFVRLNRTEAQLTERAIQLGGTAFLREAIQERLHALGFNAPGKIYLVYYDGGSAVSSCGGAPLPPAGAQGNVAALYLRGRPANAQPCADVPFATDGTQPDYWEFSALHEALHTLGAAYHPGAPGIPASCTANYAGQGHVRDSPSDLMYAGPEPWRPTALDFGRNDYFGHGRSDCPDLMKSTFLFPTVGNGATPPGWR